MTRWSNKRNPDQADHFWNGVQIGEARSCWPWSRGLDKDGYGQTTFFGKHWRAHRLAHKLATGVDPGSLCVCHSCDNPICCNPAHLFLGTTLDNVRDRIAKGRSGVCLGEDRPSARLTLSEVREIKAADGPLGIVALLAEKYGVSSSAISLIRSGRRWPHA